MTGALLVAFLLAADGPWHPLFDGKTTAGWQEITGKPFPETCWRIEDGALAAFPNPAGQQDLRTVEEFTSFELKFEWKLLPMGNSGVKYRIQKVDDWKQKTGARQARARAPEFQIADDANADVGSNLKKSNGSLYGVFAPTTIVSSQMGSFRTARLIVRGNHVEHWLDGVRVLSFELDSPEVQALMTSLRKPGEPSAFPAAGPISLQNHGSPVWFRNIRVRQLEP